MKAAANYTGPIEVGKTFALHLPHLPIEQIVTIAEIQRDTVRVRGDGIDLCYTEGGFRQIAEPRPHATRVSSFEVDPGFFVDWLLGHASRLRFKSARVSDTGGRDVLVFEVEHSNDLIPAGHVSLEFRTCDAVGNNRATLFHAAHSIPAPVYRRPDHPVDYLEKALEASGRLDIEARVLLQSWREFMDEPITEEQAAAERPGPRYKLRELIHDPDCNAIAAFDDATCNCSLLRGDGSGEALPPIGEAELLDRDIAKACEHRFVRAEIAAEGAIVRCVACGSPVDIPLRVDRGLVVVEPGSFAMHPGTAFDRSPRAISEATVNAADADAKNIHHAIAQTPQTPPRR